MAKAIVITVLYIFLLLAPFTISKPDFKNSLKVGKKCF